MFTRANNHFLSVFSCSCWLKVIMLLEICCCCVLDINAVRYKYIIEPLTRDIKSFEMSLFSLDSSQCNSPTSEWHQNTPSMLSGLYKWATNKLRGVDMNIEKRCVCELFSYETLKTSRWIHVRGFPRLADRAHQDYKPVPTFVKL